MRSKTKDARLEAISDKIRCGEPVGFFEAIEAIEYQETLRKEREQNSIINRIKRAWNVVRGEQ